MSLSHNPTMQVSFGSGLNHGPQVGSNHGNITNTINNYTTPNEHTSWSSGNIHWTVNRPVNPLFTGRDTILSQVKVNIAESLRKQDPSEPCRIVITGMGGQGKSEICLRIAHDLRRHFWGIFWVDVSTADQARQGFLAIAKRLDQAADTVEDVQQMLATVSYPCLIILDNADDPFHDYQPYIPSGHRITLLLTSRNNECGIYATAGHETLDVLEEEDALKLLLKASKIPAVQHKSCEAQARAVCDILGSHTLALIQAGSYVAKRHCKLVEYPQVYRQNRQRLLQHYSRQAQSRYRDVYATFEASAQILDSSENEENRDASELLSIMSMLDFNHLHLSVFEEAWRGARHVYAHHANGELDYPLLPWHLEFLMSFMKDHQGAWDPFRLTNAVQLLQSLALVFVDTQDEINSIYMHPLANTWARDRQARKSQQKSWLSATVLLTLTTADYRYAAESWLRAHIIALSRCSIADIFEHQPLSMIARVLIEFMWAMQYLSIDSELHSMLIEVFRTLGLDPLIVVPECLGLYRLFSTSLSMRRQTSQAVAVAEQTSVITCATVAGNSRRALDAQYELADLYLHNGQTAYAALIMERVMVLSTDNPAVTQKRLLDYRYTLAQTYMTQGQVEKGLPILEDIAKADKVDLPVYNGNRAVAQRQLARAYMEAGKTTSAIATLEEVVQVERLRPTTHSARLRSMRLLAVAYLRDDQVDRAYSVVEEVRRCERSLLDGNPERMAMDFALAEEWLRTGHISKAISLLEKVVEARQTLPSDNSNRLAAQRGLGIAYILNRQAAKALPIYEEIMAVYEPQPEDHFRRLEAQKEFAQAAVCVGEIHRAIHLMQDVVRVEQKYLPAEDPDRQASEQFLRELDYLAGQEGGISDLTYAPQVLVTLLTGRDRSRPLFQAQHDLVQQKSLLTIPVHRASI